MKLTLKQKKFADEYIISEEVYGIVYKITNIINGKCYIGVTTRNIEQRFEEHCKADSGIGKAIKKYGRGNFLKEIIDYAYNHDELMVLEIKYIEKYNSYKSGYNYTLGGEGSKIYSDLELHLTDKQQEYLNFVKIENKKTINVNDSSQMIRICLMNLISIYLTAKKIKDKISISKLTLRLKPNLLQLILDTKLISFDEINHYSNQKMSSFEAYSNG